MRPDQTKLQFLFPEAMDRTKKTSEGDNIVQKGVEKNVSIVQEEDMSVDENDGRRKTRGSKSRALRKVRMSQSEGKFPPTE